MLHPPRINKTMGCLCRRLHLATHDRGDDTYRVEGRRSHLFARSFAASNDHGPYQLPPLLTIYRIRSGRRDPLLRKLYLRRAFSVSHDGQSHPPRYRGHDKSWLNHGGRLCPPRLTDLPRRTRYTARRSKLFYHDGHLLWPTAVMFISRGGLYYLPASVNYFLN